MGIAGKLRPLAKKVIPGRAVEAARYYMHKMAVLRFKRAHIERFHPAYFEKGINLVGDFKAATGLGQSIRLLSDVIRYEDIPLAMHNYITAPDAQGEFKPLKKYGTNGYPYGINIFHINAPELPDCYMKLGKNAWNRHYNIAHWAWELEELPKEWVEYMVLADEFWTPSDFISNTLRKYTKKRCVTVPHSVTVPYSDRYDREYFGLPKNKFLYLLVYSSDSVAERKNPEAVIYAFMKAFDKGNTDVGLVIKVTPSAHKNDDINKIKKMTEKYKNIYVMVGSYGKCEINSLMKCVDVYVSLHRAEGFGLTLAEAMLLKTPTIATNWSGNTEFQNSEVAGMVKYKLVPIKSDIPPFPKGALWAEADTSDAAEYMKKMYYDKQYYNTIKEKGYAYAKKVLSKESVGSIVRDRYESIYRRFVSLYK